MTSKPRPIEHISREEIYTSFEARIEYLQNFIDFGSSDVEALTSDSRYIRALIPTIVNLVYQKLLQYDITARAFSTGSTSFEGPVDEDPDEYSPQVIHRKRFLRAYLNNLCTDPSKIEFWEYLNKVGMMHVGLGRTHPLHVEYIHIGICLGYIQSIMTEAILVHPQLQLRRKIPLVKALGKLIWIQNDMFSKWHIRDGAEFAVLEDVVVDREGYLHGKKILHPSDGSDSSEGPGTPTAESSSGTCPFSGLARGVEGLEVGDANEYGDGKEKTP